MSQNEINQAEWSNPDNWSGPRILSVYFSKKDSRTWVPKQMPEMGWTINLGKPAGAAILFGTLLGLPLLVFIIMVIGRLVSTP